MIVCNKMKQKKEWKQIIQAFEKIYEIAIEKNKLNIALQAKKNISDILLKLQKQKSNNEITLKDLTKEQIEALIQEAEKS